MGCTSSKESVAVGLPFQNDENSTKSRNLAWSDDVPSDLAIDNKPSSASSRKSKASSRSPLSIRVKSAKTEVEVISTHSLNNIEADQHELNRGVSSAKSIVSAGTCDSGLEADCPGMITEHSDPAQVRKVEDENRPSTPDLSFCGTRIEPRKRSGKIKPQTTASILGELKSQGLLTTGTAQAQSGVSFDVMIAPEFGVLKRPPARLAKLKKKKTKKRELTNEEVEQKQRAAEERRKRKEAKMIERLNTTAKERQVHSTLDATVENQRTQTKTKVAQDLDAAAQRREEHFKILRLKLEEKKKHAEKVRQAKLERLAQTPLPPENGAELEEEASVV